MTVHPNGLVGAAGIGPAAIIAAARRLAREQ